MKLSRRQFFRLGTASTAAIGMAGLGFGYSEHTRVEVSRVDIALPRLPVEFDGLTVAHLSDLHHGRYISQDYLHHCVTITNAHKPDLIVLTGDFTFGAKAYSEPCGEVLQGLRPNVASFAVLGNHDHYNSAGRVTRALRQAGITVLIDQQESLEKGGKKLRIFGVDDLHYGETDLERLYRDYPVNEARLTLSHNPAFLDVFVERRQHTDLMLSGHTHGGQVRLPVLGAPHLQLMGHKYGMGWHRAGDMQIYTTRGIGTVGPPVRLFCPPEIVLYTLRRGDPASPNPG